ncbi:MAG: hypothetical protein LBJ31_04160 [Treponema sp.]|jgi:hypothetical protein|nr:hypothetical protein [Treponema sp.]
MNITPSIFNREIQSYTAVGGTRAGGNSGVSAVLLNRGGRYSRRSFFQELEKVGFDYIVSMEGEDERYDLEELSGRFPFVRFIFLRGALSAGEMLNLAAQELSSDLFLVFWNDQKLFNGITASRMAGYFGGKRLCTAPVIQNSSFRMLHTLVIPTIEKGMLKTIQETPEREGLPTLFPHDWTGIYDRRRFLRVGGFDGAISSPYWQLMDFGFRSFLWGEEIRSTQLFRFVHDGEYETNVTVDSGYRLFYLKNIAPVFRGDHAYLPLRRFPVFLAKSGWDILGSWHEFSHERAWVKQNASRFSVDAHTLIDNWETQ